MDNLAEINPGQEPQIPAEWNFPEKGTPGLKVEQIDYDNRFLAFSLPDSFLEKKEDSGEYADYFFTPDGNPTDHRIHTLSHTSIQLVGDLTTECDIYEGSSSNPTRPFEINILPSNLEGTIDRLDYIKKAFATFSFESTLSNGRLVSSYLDRVVLSRNFLQDKDGKTIISPNLAISSRHKEGLTTADWKASTLLDIHFDRQTQKDNEIIFNDRKGNKVFIDQWEVVDGKLVVRETYLPDLKDNIVKAFSAPVILKMDEILDAAFSKPPYPKDERGKLIVPWTNIDRIVGASISYSYPPLPKKNHNK